MAFQCPKCQKPFLRITGRLEILPDSTWDEITLQIVRCAACSFTGIAIYQESRRGALDHEIIYHTGYQLSLDIVKDLQKAVKGCPHPGNPKCNCSTHKTINLQTSEGRWNPPFNIDWKTSFPMKYMTQLPNP